MKAAPSPVEIAMIAAPIYAAYITQGHGSYVDAVNDARQLIESAGRPLGAATGERLISTEKAAIEIGYVSRNWHNQLRTLCIKQWELIAKQLPAHWHNANGETFFAYYDKQWWDARTIEHVKAAKQAALTDSRKRPKPRKENLA